VNVIECGKCEICGKDAPLQRTYFYYDIQCECHSPQHFEVVSHCADCTPSEPRETRVTLSAAKLRSPISIALDILEKEFLKDRSPGSYYGSWVDNIACCIMNQYSDSEENHLKANRAAKAFVDKLIRER